MTRLHVGPGCDDYDDPDNGWEPERPSRRECEELTAAAWDALFHRAKHYEEDRWAS